MTPELQSRAAALQFALRENKSAVEAGSGFSPKFDEHGLIPAIATDAVTGEVLMLAYMNEQSLRLTLALGEAVYFSRSRKELWHKGATSGHVQRIVEILTDCDQDAIVLRVQQLGAGACHTGYRSCFYRRTALDGDAVRLEQIIAEKSCDPAKVYGSAKTPPAA
jgi:phosphoribosyl-AMP cyclohydrolase